MKTSLIIALLAALSTTAIAQTTKTMNTQQESAAITGVLTTYFKSIYEGDTALLGSTFAPGTLLYGDVNGQPYAKTLAQYLEGVQQRQSPKDSGKPFDGKIISIDIVNSIAIAKVQVKMYDYIYIDLLSFHKINGSWLIVNKMISNIAQ